MALGLAIAATFGPIGALCFRRTLSGGFALGFVSGLGAAVADAIYASLAAFGVSALSVLLVAQAAWLRVVGGAFLLYLGGRTLLAEPAKLTAVQTDARGLASGFASTLALTLSNPMTILSFVGIFAGLGLGSVEGVWNGVALVVGVFVGSAAWWLVLAGGASLLRSRVTPRIMRAVNVVSGLVILAFGVQSLSVLLG